MLLNGQRFTVKAVMPRSFRFPIRANPIDVWILLRDEQFNPALRTRRDARLMEVVGRLRSGISPAQAQREMDAIARDLSGRYPTTNADIGIRVVPGIDQTVGDASRVLWLFFAAVGCILLLACVNVGHVLLARAVQRQHEIAVRAALGAARERLWRQMLVEGLVLWSAGGVLGALSAAWGIRGLVAFLPADLPRIDEIGIDFRVMAFTGTITAITGLCFSLMPASIATRVNLTGLLQQSARTSSAGARARRLSECFAAGEIAFATILMTGAVLFVASFVRLSAPVPGFDPGNVLTFELSWPNGKYTRTRAAQAFEAVQSKLLAIPRVRAASVGIQLPDRGAPLLDDVLPIVQPAGDSANTGETRTAILPILPGYFRATGIPLTRGRDFTSDDRSQAPPVVIINEALARLSFQGRDPVGRRLRMSAWTFPDRVPEIVGVARDVKHSGVSVGSSPLVYLPLPQYPVNVATMVVKTGDNPLALIGAVREAVASIDPDQPIYDIQPLESRLAESLAFDGFRAMLMTIFAGAAALLAASGLFAVLSYAVAHRTHELGIRIALGAERSDVLRLVLRQGMTTAVAGIGIGIVTAMVFARVVSAVLSGVGGAGAPALAIASAMLLVVAFLACILPALRATRVDPVVALE
jgi:putative ABC transport system permease protein